MENLTKVEELMVTLKRQGGEVLTILELVQAVEEEFKSQHKLVSELGYLYSASQVVQELKKKGIHKNLTTTVLYDFFASKDLGTFKIRSKDKIRTFQPNDNFDDFFYHEQKVVKHKTLDETKQRLSYTKDAIDYIFDNYKDELNDYVETYSRYIHARDYRK